MSKILSAKYYQENNERLQERARKDIKIFLKKKKKTIWSLMLQKSLKRRKGKTC